MRISDLPTDGEPNIKDSSLSLRPAKLIHPAHESRTDWSMAIFLDVRNITARDLKIAEHHRGSAMELHTPFQYVSGSFIVARPAPRARVSGKAILHRIRGGDRFKRSTPTAKPPVSPELSCRLIILRNFGYRAMLLPYEPCTFFRDQFPDGRVPLPTFPTA